MIKIIKEEKRKYIASIKEKMVGRKVVIYGAGKIGKGLAKLLNVEKISVKYFCVTDESFNLLEYKGIPIKSFEQLKNDGKQYIFLIGINPPKNSGIVKMMEENNFTYIDVLSHIDQIVDDKFFRPTLEITPKVGCTINCHYCPQRKFIHNYFSNDKNRDIEMSFDLFKRCIDKTPQDTVIEFAGFVEPFLAKDAIKMMKYTYETGREMTLFTTLVGCNLDKFHKIEDLPFRYVVLHLPDFKNYASIPITEDYLKLLQYLMNKRKANGESFVDKANCQAEPNPEIAALLKDKIMISWDLIDRAGNLDNEAGLRSDGCKAGRIYCDRAANINHNILLPDGSVVLCCMDFGMQHVIGNLATDTYEGIMNGEKILSIKKGMNLDYKDDSILCRSCTSAVLLHDECKDV